MIRPALLLRAACRRVVAPVVASALLAGCASFTSDGGIEPAARMASGELGKDVVKVADEAIARSVQIRVEELLRKPLTADAAVQIALLKNRGLQAAFNDLGVAEAVYVKATLPPEPTLSIGRLATGLELEIERRILIGLFELATLPQRAAVAEQRFRAAQFRAAEAVLRLAAETRRRYYGAVAANQQVGSLQRALATAGVSSELARQLGETGALNKLEQAREHAFYVELGAQLAQARIQQKVERERLTRQLGLWGRDADFRLPGSLPALPARLETAKELEARALKRRADLIAMRHDLDATAGQYGLTEATRFVTDFELAGTIGRSREETELNGVREIERKRIRGFEIEFRIPIYDFGETSVRNAREAYLGAANRLAERAVNARSEVREAYFKYRGQYDLARHYQGRVLPLRKTIQDESLLQYSGMLVDVTRLIADARARILSNVDAINARRDFWIAATDLKAALIGGGSGAAEGGGRTSAAAATGDAGH